MAKRNGEPRAPAFGVVNLGCPKNTVDTERLMAEMALAGFAWVEDPADADVCIVNTCGFLAAARAEAAETLRQLAETTGALLVATGCLVERAGGEPDLGEALSAADACVGFADYPRLPEICVSLLRGRRGGGAKPVSGFRRKGLPKRYLDWLDGPRLLSGAGHLAFLKLGEGCSNHCAYCAIPLIRGERRSRPLDSVLDEAAELSSAGVKELSVIAQDTTAYGLDRGEALLPELIRRLPQAAPEVRWFRLLYAHPKHLSDGILAALAAERRFVRYVDLPLQHATDRMLARMGRGVSRADVEDRLAAIRRLWRGAAVRTTFIAGHPGETPADAAELRAFVRRAGFEAMGAFVYSPEPGTLSARMPDAVPPAEAERRAAALYAVQRQVWRDHAAGRIGKTASAMLDERTPGGWRGHLPWQMPGEDGCVRIRMPRETAVRAKPGDILRVRLLSARFPDYSAEPATP